jgi:hypothetical protein
MRFFMAPMSNELKQNRPGGRAGGRDADGPSERRERLPHEW